MEVKGMQVPYRGLKIEVPMDCLAVESFLLTEELNEHAKLTVEFLMEEEDIQEAVEKIGEKTCIIVYEQHVHEKKELPIFKGRPMDVQMIEKRGLYYLKVEAIGYTYDWDMEKKSRTFCDLDLTYQQVIRNVLGDYSKFDFQDEVTKGVGIPDFLLQYEETDWEFLKRLATHFETYLLPDSAQNFGRTYFGLPRLNHKTELQQIDYHLKKDMKKYQLFNAIAPYYQQETITWEITTRKRLYLGEELTFNQVRVQVTRVEIQTSQDELLYTYTLSRMQGVKKRFQTNPLIYGMSIPAVVKERKGNTVRVHFDIDPTYETKPNLKYFTYAIESSSWYCMPEEGSKVHIYFPSHDEKEAIAVHAIRSAGAGAKYASRAQNPDHKSFSHVTGSEMKLTPKDINIAADDEKKISIHLDQEGNMLLLGKKMLFNTQKSLSIGEREAKQEDVEPVKPKHIEISAKEGVYVMREGDASQSIRMEEENLVVAIFVKKDASVKAPPSQSPASFDRSAEDQALIDAKNANAEAMLEAKRQQGLGNIKKGLSALASVAVVAGFVALSVATGGAAALVAGPVMVGMLTATAVTGTAVAVMAVSDIAEGVQDYNKSQQGDLSKSYNFVRDEIFGGNEELYRMVQGGTEFVFGMVSSVVMGGASIGKCGPLKNMFIQGALGQGESLLQDFIDDGRIDWGKQGLNLGINLLSTKMGKGALKKLKLDKLQGAKKVFSHSVVETGVEVLFLGGKEIAKVVSDPEYKAEDINWAQLGFQSAGIFGRRLIGNALTTYTGDPINVVTGSLEVEAKDLILADIGGDFYLKRTYYSISNRTGMLGKGWVFNYESKLVEKEGSVCLLTVSGQLKSFQKEEDSYISTTGDLRYTLQKEHDLWAFYDQVEKKTYFYNAQGLLTKIINSNNQKITLSYRGNTLEKIKTFSGYEVDFIFDQGKLVQVKDQIGRTIQYKYEGDYLTYVVHIDHGIATYAYNEEGYMSQLIDQNGVTYTKNAFDEKGRVILQEYSNGDTCQATYEDAERRSTFYYTQTGRTECYHYNQQGLITETLYEDGTVLTYGYDAYGNRDYEKDRRGNETKRVYNAYGNLVEESFTYGLVISYTYDGNQNLIQKKDNGGRETLYSYDENHQLIEERDKIAAGKWETRSWQYDEKGRIIYAEDGLKGVTRYSYDKGHRQPSRMITPTGEETTYEYDEVGRQMTIQNAIGRVELGYNPLNYVSRIKDGEGNVTQKYYDKMGNLMSLYPPRSLEEKAPGYSYRYDFLDRLTQVKDPLSSYFKVERDTEGNITKEIHPNAYDLVTEDGKGTEHIYDSDNRRIKTLYPDGGTERFVYDSEGNLVKHILPEYYNEAEDDGIGYRYTYDAAARLKEVITPEGIVEKSYGYDLHGNKIEETDAKGATTYYAYDLQGRLLEKREPLEEKEGQTHYKLTVYIYDLSGNKIEEKYAKEPVGKEGYPTAYHSLYFTYDAGGRLTQVKDDYKAMALYRYNGLNQKTYEEFKINDNAYKSIHYSYDKAGRLTQQKEALDALSLGEKRRGTVWAITSYRYDGNGNLIETITPKGHKILRKYDLADRLIEERHIDEANGIDRTTSYHYDAVGNVIRTTFTAKDKEEVARKYSYDLKDRLTHVVDEEGHTTRYFYDANDRLIKEVSPSNYNEAKDDGEGIRYFYNWKGNLTKKVSPLGETLEETIYDAAGNVKAYTDEQGRKREYTYNLFNQVEAIYSPLSKKEDTALQKFAYNERGQVIGIEDGKGEKTTYKVDGWGRITEIQTAEGGTERYAYDYAGNITTTTDANGNTITYTYNSFGKVQEIVDPEGNKEKFFYDVEGNLIRYEDRNGNTQKMDYNLDGNLIKREGITPDGTKEVVESFSYFADGLLAKAKTGGMAYHYDYTPSGRLQSKQASGKTLLEYTYHPGGQLQSLKDVTGKISYYSYDKAQRLLAITDEKRQQVATYQYSHNSLVGRITYGNGIQTSFTYDEDAQTKSLMTALPNGEKLTDYQYNYDLNGNRTAKQGAKHQTFYGYDVMNRLQTASYDGKEEQFTYDKVGNRLTYQTEEDKVFYGYNVKNQLVEMKQKLGVTLFTYDPQGNTIKEESNQGSRHFAYDALGRQVKAVTEQGDTLLHRYDAEGLRCEIEENEKVSKFIFHKGNLLTELNEEDAPVSRWIRGHEVVGVEKYEASNDELDDAESLSTTYLPRRYFYHQDEQGSTVSITNEHQEEVNAYHYDAFGKILEAREGIANPITYTGQQYDQATQQYYLRARFYNPAIGRFTQEDVYRGDGLNLYAYCKANPVMYYDPTGYMGNPCKQGNISEGDDATPRTDKNKNGEEGMDSPVTYRGGKHGDTKLPIGDGLDSHHMPSKQSSPLDFDDGPAIQMDPADHRLTASYGGREGSPQQIYRDKQKALIEQGLFDEAFLMDVDDIQSKFGNKYDNAILEAIDALIGFSKYGN
jgi:RHS repeat-associated protein